MTNRLLLERRKKRVRRSIVSNNNGRARLVVFRSGRHIYAQIIDDLNSTTIAQASTLDKDIVKDVKKSGGSNVNAAKLVGTLIAKRAKAAKVSEVVFDRGGYLYHGRVKALAVAAREGGLVF